jgi:predicted Fe-S protein YdhL (DUF1289 family)
LENVVSPCVSICRLDPAQGLCTGCLRTMDEIAGWSEMTMAERAGVLAAVKERKASSSFFEKKEPKKRSIG